MAIIIPSKRIYTKDNDISPNNALSSIFLTENVVKFIEEKPNVKTTKIDDFSSFVVQNSVDSGNMSILAPENISENSVITIAGYNYVHQRFQSSVVLERISEENYITKVAPTVQINFNFKLFKNRTPFEHYADSGVSSFSWQKNDSKVDTYEKQYDYDSNSFVQDLSFSVEGDTSFSSSGIPYASISISEGFKISFFNRSFSNKDEKNQSSFAVPIQNLFERVGVTQTKERFTLNFAIPSKLIIEVASVGIPRSMLSKTFGKMTDSYVLVITPQSVDITWNETIKKLDIQEKEVVISSADSVNNEANIELSRNSFINTTAGVSSPTANLYQSTFNINKNGKEIATVRCSVNDYYDDSGNLAISIKTPDKMLFRIGDKVVPMILNSEGVDVPMSSGDNLNAKIFEVVGCNLMFNGAIWQELTLREYTETAIKTKLPTPRIQLSDGIVYITDTSGLAESFEVYINGVYRNTITDNQYNLTTLDLEEGNYRIYVIATAYNYYNSDNSNSVTYTVVAEPDEPTVEKLSAPIISLDGDILTITDESGLAEEFDIIVDGEVKDTVEGSVN